MAPPAGKGKVQGKGKGKGKGKSKGKGTAKSKWQITLESKWEDYGDEEDRILKRAIMVGQPNAKFQLRGQHYLYNFTKMVQVNLDTNKERKIRPPKGIRVPRKALLPSGPMTIITVGTCQSGTTINITDPMTKQNVPVFVPAHAKPGQKLAVPLPGKGESVADVQKKQDAVDKQNGTKTSWSTGAKTATAMGGAALVGGAALGGIILGDHLAGGDMAATVGAAVVDAAEDVWDGVTDAADAVADWAPGAADAAGDWTEGAVDDVGEFGGEAVDWFEDAGEDIGDFVMDLF